MGEARSRGGSAAVVVRRAAADPQTDELAGQLITRDAVGRWVAQGRVGLRDPVR